MRLLVVAASLIALVPPISGLAQTTYPAISTLFGAAAPALTNATDPGVPYTLGTVFTASANGQIEQIRFYKAASDTATHVGRVWSYDTQAVLASVTFTGESASGWQAATLATPLPVAAGVRTVVTVDIGSHYADTIGGLASPVISGYLSTATGVPNGVYGAPGTFPTGSYQSSNYFVDASFHVLATLLSSQVPMLTSADDGVPYELGTRFTPAVDGTVQAIRYWRSPSETGGHVGHLWTDQGQLLATVSFTGESASGWQVATLPAPVAVHGGQAYVVSSNVNQFYVDTVGGLAAPGIDASWLSSVVAANNGVYGAPGAFPTQGYETSNYFRDVVFAPAPGTSVTVQPTPAFTHRGWLGWLRDLASQPAPTDAYWPYLAIDPRLIADYDFAGTTIAQAGANEIEIWGLTGAGGDGNAPGYAVTVEQTASPARVAQIRQIIGGLHAKGLEVLAGTGGMSWGFDRIIAANPSMACPNSPYVANPFVPLSWEYQFRIIDYLFSFGIDGITVQSGDQGRCDVPEGAAIASDVDYHARIVDRFATYVRAHYPRAIIGSANYGISFANPADLPHLQALTRHLDYVNDIVGGIDPAYRRQLIAAIAPAQFGTEAPPNAGGSLVHVGPETFWAPTARRDVSNLQANYALGDRANENYMRVLANPGEEVSGRLTLMYEANPASDFSANLDSVLTQLYQPTTPAALAMLRDLMLTGEDAYFNNAGSQSLTIEAFYDYNDRGFPFLRDNMTASGRQAYRTALVALQTEAASVLPLVGAAGQGRVQSIQRCIANTIAEIDALSAP